MPNLPTSCTIRRLNPQDQLGRLCVYVIYKSTQRAPTKVNKHWRQECIGVGPNQNLSCPHSRSREQHSVGGRSREVRWTVSPRDGKVSDSSDSKVFIFLMFSLFFSYFWIFFLFFFFLSSPPLSVAVFNFICTMKCNQAFELFTFFFSVTFFTVIN